MNEQQLAAQFYAAHVAAGQVAEKDRVEWQQKSLAEAREFLKNTQPRDVRQMQAKKRA